MTEHSNQASHPDPHIGQPASQNAAKTRALKEPSPGVKLALEMGPLVVFFLANSRPEFFRALLAPLLGGLLPPGPQGAIFVATATFMIALGVSLAVSWWICRHLPIMPLVSGAVVLVFGVLTLTFHNDMFIKLKPTIVNALFGGVLLGGLAFGKPLLPYVFGTVFRLSPEGWRILTWRWGLFFFALAALNEAIWRSQSTDFWVAFKVWGMMPITLAFTLAQTPLMMRHGFEKVEADGASENKPL